MRPACGLYLLLGWLVAACESPRNEPVSEADASGGSAEARDSGGRAAAGAGGAGARSNPAAEDAGGGMGGAGTGGGGGAGAAGAGGGAGAGTPDAPSLMPDARQGVQPVCGNGVLEGNETCDPPASCEAARTGCGGEDRETVVRLSGSPATCTFTCQRERRLCGPPDGYCPTGCTPGTDMDCKNPLGAACTDGSTCQGVSCVDGVCCARSSCAPCQRCSQPGGTCVAVAAGMPDNDPVSPCTGDQRCDGAGSCQVSCQAPKRTCHRDDESVFACAAGLAWGFEEGDPMNDLVGAGAGVPTTERSHSGARSLVRRGLTGASPYEVVGSLRFCDRNTYMAHVTGLAGRFGSVWIYIDRPAPLGQSSLTFETQGTDGMGYAAEHPVNGFPVRQWFKMTAPFGAFGAEAGGLLVLFHGHPSDTATTSVYIDDAMVE